MNDRIVAMALSTLAASILVGAFLLTHERVEIDRHLPATGEARLNPLLAAEHLLQDLGYHVASEIEFVPSFELPADGDTAFAYFNYRGLRDDDLQILLDWVARGGHLVVEIQPKFGRSYDPVFTPLEIKVSTPEIELDPLAELVDKADKDAPADRQPQRPPHERFPGRAYWGDMTLDNKRHIDFGPNETVWTIADETGVFAGQIGYGDGLLTVVSDLSFVTNLSIGDLDHAYIFTRLVGDPSNSGKVWLYYGQQFPSLLDIVWNKAGFLIKAGLLLLVLVLWRMSGRFGPQIPAPARARKAFLEHVSANGRFLWRKHKHAVLVAKTQQSFLRDFERRHPGSRHLDEAGRVRFLADICDIPEQSVDNALRDLRGRGHHDFTEKMQLLRTLWTRI